MTEFKKKKKKRTGLWVVLAILVVAGSLVGWQVVEARQRAQNALDNIETEPYRRGDLSASIFGTGTVQPLQTAALTWKTGGTVGEVYVSIGQTVEKGQLLMSLDPDSVSADILQAQIDVINIQNALDELYENWGADLAQARLDLLNAEETLENLDTRRARMNSQRCSDARIEDLEEEYERAEQVYQFRQDALSLRAVNTALANLNFCRADFSDREVAEADLELELAQARVERGQNRVDLLSDGPDPDQVTIFETQLAIAQSRLDSPNVTAPFDGMVTALPVQPGDVVTVGAQAVQLDNLSGLNLDVQISEIDIPFVEVGQPAQLVFDAYFELTFDGEVTEISPVGRAVQGVVEYTVRVKLLDANERIRPGMTAAVNIVFEEKEAVFLVPNDAIVSRNGEDLVYVRRNGDYVGVPVVLGSYSDFYSQVLEADIIEGELIVLNPPAAITGQTPFGGPPGGGFGN